MTRLHTLLRAATAALASVAWAALAQPAEPPAIALVVPGQHTIFAQAAEAVRQGFFAAHRVEGQSVAIQVIEVDDDPRQLADALAAARARGVRVAVGPLPRAAVNSVVEGRHAVLPLIALNHPDWEAGVPPTMVSIGLSAEMEAQRVVQVALGEFVPLRRSTEPRLLVLAGASSLERRVAAAFVAALRARSEVARVVDVTAETLDHVARQFDAAGIEAVFLALGVREAALARSRIPRQMLVFGTSLVSVAGSGPLASALAQDLEGVRFVEMPWLLQPDHPAVMIYPSPSAPLPAELNRLYALGIDAYRVAQQWMAGRQNFELDGVTGFLRLDRSRSSRIERTPLAAIYRGGAIEREDVAR